MFLTFGREAWASVQGAGSVLRNLASALRWGPLQGHGIGARYGVRSNAWASQRPSYLYLNLSLVTLSLLLTFFLILSIKSSYYHSIVIVFVSVISFSEDT